MARVIERDVKIIKKNQHFAVWKINVVKAFYTAGFIYDIVNIFGEPSEEVLHHRKYAKWKSTYIHNCLKNGITPVPGPMALEGEKGDVILRPEDYHKAQKLCKWAGSALQYEDAPTAIENLQKALRLLTTGQDS
ncbi:UNVERIFIED_CONTAM: Vacuolar protein sorting-associated protein VTA1 [Trichonephila clavipes]